MLLKIYLAGLLLSFLFTLLYYWLVVTDSLVIDIVAAFIIISLSWIGVFIFLVSIKTIIYRAKEKRLEKLRRGEPFIDFARNSEKDLFTNSDTEPIPSRVKTALRITKDQLN